MERLRLSVVSVFKSWLPLFAIFPFHFIVMPVTLGKEDITPFDDAGFGSLAWRLPVCQS